MKNILALFIVLLFVASSGCGSQSASSHDFIDLETNYELSDVAAPLYTYLNENDGYCATIKIALLRQSGLHPGCR